MTQEEFLQMLKQVFSIPEKCNGGGTVVMKFRCVDGRYEPIVEEENDPETASRPSVPVQ